MPCAIQLSAANDYARSLRAFRLALHRCRRWWPSELHLHRDVERVVADLDAEPGRGLTSKPGGPSVRYGRLGPSGGVAVGAD